MCTIDQHTTKGSFLPLVAHPTAEFYVHASCKSLKRVDNLVNSVLVNSTKFFFVVPLGDF